jgi:hypothetical protein
MMMVLHVFLHWKWIKIKIQGSSGDLNQTKKRSAFAIALFIIVLMLLLAPFLSPVDKSNRGHERHDVHVEAIG